MKSPHKNWIIFAAAAAIFLAVSGVWKYLNYQDQKEPMAQRIDAERELEAMGTRHRETKAELSKTLAATDQTASETDTYNQFIAEKDKEIAEKNRKIAEATKVTDAISSRLDELAAQVEKLNGLERVTQDMRRLTRIKEEIDERILVTRHDLSNTIAKTDENQSAIDLIKDRSSQQSLRIASTASSPVEAPNIRLHNSGKPVDIGSSFGAGMGFGGSGTGFGGGFVHGGHPPDLEHFEGESPKSTESYQDLRDNPFLSPHNEPLSTFSIDVDSASYANVRRYLMHQSQPPPIGAVRIEELVNYFDYAYDPPPELENPERNDLPVEHPFATHIEIASAPWKKDHRLVKIGLKGYEIPLEKRPPSNLVFLIDVSGSMRAANKLPLVKRSLGLLVDGLTLADRVAVVVYAGASGIALDSTPGSEADTIREAVDRLASGGGTNAGKGIELAYKLASDSFIAEGNNRVVLCTDGDFNVGTTDQGSLRRLLETNAKKGIQLSILGFGMGNYKDDMLESLSNAGDGNYGYIDSFREAKKVFVRNLLGTLIMIAKDVKIQVEFNPAKVAAYRLIGYENRLLKAKDFKDDKVDSGDIGSGHTVTAFYEIVPPGAELPDQTGKIDLHYQKPKDVATDGESSEEMLTVKLRYKWPGTDRSRLFESPATDLGTDFEKASEDFKFASAVAGFGMLLRQSPHSGTFTYEMAIATAKANLGADSFGDRKEFVEIVRQMLP